MYKVKFYSVENKLKRNHFHFYLFNNKQLIYDCLTFSQFVSYLELNNISFKNVRFSCSLDDLFYHIVDYKSVQRFINYDEFEDKKKKMLGDDI